MPKYAYKYRALTVADTWEMLAHPTVPILFFEYKQMK